MKARTLLSTGDMASSRKEFCHRSNVLWKKSRTAGLLTRLSIRVRADAFNVLNRAQFGAPNADWSNSNFGVITTTISNYATGRGTPREFQLSAKIIF